MRSSPEEREDGQDKGMPMKGNAVESEDTIGSEDGQLGERRPKVGRRPDTPTKVEMEEHMCLHVHYRSWCPHCVAGRSISRQHRRKDAQEESLGRVISIDYAFKIAEEVEADAAPVLVAFDHTTKAIWALEVDSKGEEGGVERCYPATEAGAVNHATRRSSQVARARGPRA